VPSERSGRVTPEEKLAYAGMCVLKKLDLRPADGGVLMPLLLPSELSALQEVLDDLHARDLVQVSAKKTHYELSQQGIAYLGELIDEAAALVEEFDDVDGAEMVEALEARHLDPFRARFLWSWYDGELDDLVRFQERRGIRPVERDWAYFLLADAFYEDLARDLG
jgi:hypothetical protein